MYLECVWDVARVETESIVVVVVVVAVVVGGFWLGQALSQGLQASL